MNTPNFRDVEQLSALLDGKLSPAEAAKLESRLRSDRTLQAILDDLTQTRSLLRRLPRRKAPRNFTLTRQMAGVKPPTPRAVPTLRFATLLATFLLVFSLATNTLTTAMRQAAQAPVYGMGGGGGGAEDSGPAIMSEAATEPPAATLLPPEAASEPMTTLVPTLLAEEQPLDLQPTPDPSLKTGLAPDSEPAPAPAPASAPIPPAWLIGLLIIALICGVAAWLISRASERSWRAKTK